MLQGYRVLPLLTNNICQIICAPYITSSHKFKFLTYFWTTLRGAATVNTSRIPLYSRALCSYRVTDILCPFSLQRLESTDELKGKQRKMTIEQAYSMLMLSTKNKAAKWSTQRLVVTVYTTYCNSKKFRTLSTPHTYVLVLLLTINTCTVLPVKLKMKFYIRDLSSHNRTDGDSKRLGCFVVSTGKLLPTFRWSTLPSSSGSNSPSTLQMNALRSTETQNTLQPARRLVSSEVFYSQNLDKNQSAEGQTADGACAASHTTKYSRTV